MPTAITTILLDAGGVLLDERTMEQSRAEGTAAVLANYVSGYTVDSYWDDIEDAVRAFSPHAYHHVFWKRLQPDVARYDEALAHFEAQWRPVRPPMVLMEGIAPEVRRLATRFRVGIAGQYGREILDVLEAGGVLEHLTWHFTQSDFPITKPDPRYYQQIVDRCGVPAPACVMVGDRIDKDVIPAKQLGMKTVRVRLGLHRRQEPRTPAEIPDVELGGVVGLAAAIEELVGPTGIRSD